MFFFLHVQFVVDVALVVFYNFIGCFTRQLIQFQKDKVNRTDAIVLGQANCTIVYRMFPFLRSYMDVSLFFFTLLKIFDSSYCLLCTIHIAVYGVFKWKVEKLTGSLYIILLLFYLSLSLSLILSFVHIPCTKLL